MSRDFDILAGCAINDLDEASSPAYYGYARSEGSWVIMKKTATEVRYAVGGDNYATAWAGKAGLSYARAEAYKY